MAAIRVLFPNFLSFGHTKTVIQTQGKDAIFNFTDSLTETATKKINFGCKKDFEPVFDTMRQLQSLLDLGIEITDSAFKMTECERMANIYGGLVYDGTCTYSVSGFSWFFICLLAISFSGMIMITLRSSYHNTKFMEDDDSEIKGKDLNESDGKLSVGVGTTLNEDEGLASYHTNISRQDEETGESKKDESKEVVEESNEVDIVEEEIDDKVGEMADFSVSVCPSIDDTGDSSRRASSSSVGGRPHASMDVSC